MDFGDFFRHLFLVMASSLGLVGIPLPLPLPPLPEDPALLRAAPADSLLFVEWFGTAGPTEQPSNRSERLATEPEVRAMITKLVAATRGMIERQGGDDPEAVAALRAFDLLLGVTQRPGCVFVAPGAPFSAGLVVHYGADVAQAATDLGAIIKMLPADEIEQTTRSIGGVAFRQLIATDGDLPFLGWATIDGYLAIAFGEPVAEQLVAGLRGDAQGLAGLPALQMLRAGCKVERPVLRTYAAVAELAEQIQFASRMWEPLGIGKATAGLAESGLEGDDFVSRLQLALPKNEGLLGDLRGKPLSQDDLVLIPDDATVAIAMRGQDGSFENQMLHVLAALSGQSQQDNWNEFRMQVARRSQVDMRDDLIKNAGDCTVAWSSPRQGGIGFTGLVAAVPLRDGKAFGENLDRMWQNMIGVAPNKAQDRAEGRRISHRAYLEQFEHGGRPVWWVDLIDDDVPFAFSWASTDRHFLFGLLPQPVRSAIDSSQLPNFDRALARTPTVARRGDASAMLYIDLQDLLRQAYAPGLMLLAVGSYEWQREGFDFDLADVPRLQALAPHLGPELVLLTPTENGCTLTRRGSLPVLDPLLVTCGMAFLFSFGI